MDFSTALLKLKQGHTVSRFGWNARHHLDILDPDPGDIVNRSYIAIETANGDIVPWVASQTDLLAADWFIKEEERAECTPTVTNWCSTPQENASTVTDTQSARTIEFATLSLSPDMTLSVSVNRVPQP